MNIKWLLVIGITLALKKTFRLEAITMGTRQGLDSWKPKVRWKIKCEKRMGHPKQRFMITFPLSFIYHSLFLFSLLFLVRSSFSFPTQTPLLIISLKSTMQPILLSLMLIHISCPFLSLTFWISLFFFRISGPSRIFRMSPFFEYLCFFGLPVPHEVSNIPFF